MNCPTLHGWIVQHYTNELSNFTRMDCPILHKWIVLHYTDELSNFTRMDCPILHEWTVQLYTDGLSYITQMNCPTLHGWIVQCYHFKDNQLKDSHTPLKHLHTFRQVWVCLGSYVEGTISGIWIVPHKGSHTTSLNHTPKMFTGCRKTVMMKLELTYHTAVIPYHMTITCWSHWSLNHIGARQLMFRLVCSKQIILVS